MLVTVILFTITCGIVTSSEIHPVAPAGVAPIVTAASSQYFERTFNRLVAAPPVVQPVLPIRSASVAPSFPISPAVIQTRPILSVLPVAQAPPVVVDARSPSVPRNPVNTPTITSSSDPNVAIAVATAHAAAPVATILLPPYPFGIPTSYGLLPQTPQMPQEPSVSNTKELTTAKTTTTVQATTTEEVQDATTPVPSNIDNSFAQALPSNQNVNFRQYLTPQRPIQRPGPQQLPIPRPQEIPRDQNTQQVGQRFPDRRPYQAPQHIPLPEQRPLKFKTKVEIVPVPLAYIAPPSSDQHHHHHHQHHHHHHQSLKLIPHIHTFIPRASKIIIRPLSRPLTIKTLRVPIGFAKYGPPKVVKRVASKYPQKIISIARETEPTTFNPINRPFTKPPRI